jgi:radical SAM family uncharacterized protein/radical SAM-linked protein
MIEDILHGIEKPGRYIGGEINACGKDFGEAAVRFALAFPDVYEVGLSHLGLRLLYHLLNGIEGVMADRVYAPWLDFEERLRSLGEPLRGIETERALGEFDFVGFSLQYELSYTNILTILDLAGIPLEAKDRRATDPWIIAGGPCAFNPEPLADFFDFIVLGEAEEVLPEIIEAFRKWRASGGARPEFLRSMSRIPGVYVPSFFDVSYHPDGVVAAVEPHYGDYARVGKRLLLDLDQGSPVPDKPLVPLVDIVHNRLSVEIARGCTRGCRFCQAGFIYRPVRERDPRVLLDRTEQALMNSGFEEISVLSLSTGDYCQIQPLLTALMDRFASERVAVSFPSMRVGTLTPQLMESVKRVRKTGFTLAPEAGSERLRAVINKRVLDQDLLEASHNAFNLGWRILKLYFMIGLPTETEEDLDAMVSLCHQVRKLARSSKSSVNISISTFVPKPMTPFQWVSQLSRDEIRNRLGDLKERLNRPGLHMKWNDPSHSILEAVFARGDRRLGKVIRRAWELGARFDGWSEIFREDLWQQAFQETAIDPSFYALRERSRDEILPWDHLSAGVEKEFLWKEFERARSGEPTPDCRWSSCSNCGVCDHKTIAPQLHASQDGSLSLQRTSARSGEQDLSLYWFRYSKVGKIRFLGQLEIVQSFSRAIRRSGLPAAYSKGFHPHVKLSFTEALPLGYESLVEEGYLTLTERVDPETVRSSFNRYLPRGLRIEEVAEVVKRTATVAGRRVTYAVSALIPWMARSASLNWSRHLRDELTKKTKRGEVRAPLGEILLDLRQSDETTLEMDLFERPQICFRPNVVLHQLLGEPFERLSECRICKVGVSNLAEWEGKEDGGRAHYQQ